MRIMKLGAAGALAVASGFAARATTPCEPHWLPVEPRTFVSGRLIADITLWDDDGSGPRQPRVVLSGLFSSAGGVPAASIAAWDGREWTEIGGGSSSIVASVLGLTDGRLAVAGGMSKLGATNVNGIAVWDGVTWSGLGSGLSGSAFPVNFQVNALSQAANGDLFAAGGFTMAGGKPVNNIARWDGVEWWALGQGLTKDPAAGYAWVSCLYWVSPTELLAGGFFGKAGDVVAKGLAKWNGQSWEAFPGNLNGTVWSVAKASDQTIYVAGSLSAGMPFTPQAMNVAASNGTQWQRLAEGLSVSGGFSAVRDVAILPTSHVVFAGDIWRSGGVNMPYISEWNGTSWLGLASGLSRPVQRLLVLPSGELLAGLDSGGMDSTGTSLLRRWGSARTAWIARQPQSTPAPCGGPATLAAALASGYDAASVTWKRGDAILVHDPAAGVRIEYADGVSTLRLDNLRPESAGLYRCMFDFGCNQVESAPAALAVSGACCPGDLTLDAIVDDQDFQVFAAAYNLVVCGDSTMAPGCPADLNRDGLVDDSDFELFVQAYNDVVCAA